MGYARALYRRLVLLRAGRWQFHNDHGVVLEFRAHIGPLVMKGIDMIQLNTEGQISDFEVMIRPAKGLQAVATAMAQQLALATSPESEQ